MLKEQINKRIKIVSYISKESILNFLAPFPQKVALDLKIVEETDQGSYLQTKLAYYVEEEDLVTAYLLIPKEIKFDAVVFCHHQHAGNHRLGKSEVVGLAGDPNQHYAKELTELGFVTFCPDAIAFEERSTGDADWVQHYFELAGRIVKGTNLLAKALHDVSVGIDAIHSFPKFQEFKIGFIGHSYGGKMAIWAPFYDDRISASVSNCGCLPYRHPIRKDCGYQMEFCIPNITQHFDIENIVALIEPCSLLISATNNDVWAAGHDEVYDYAKPYFKKGFLALKKYEGGHVFTPEMRTNAYAFLSKYLS